MQLCSGRFWLTADLWRSASSRQELLQPDAGLQQHTYADSHAQGSDEDEGSCQAEVACTKELSRSESRMQQVQVSSSSRGLTGSAVACLAEEAALSKTLVALQVQHNLRWAAKAAGCASTVCQLVRGLCQYSLSACLQAVLLSWHATL